MDEQPLSSSEQVSAGRLLRGRFGSFAGAHFCYAIACLFLISLLIAPLSALWPLYWPDWLLEGLFGWLLPMALMGGYFLLGYWFGGKDVWPLPLRGRDLAWSVLIEASLAWCWAGLVIGTFYAEIDLAFVMFFLSIFLAFPSSVFVWMGLATLGFGGIADLVCMGFLAGLLPPLLFHIGSYWRTWRAAQQQNGRL